MGKCLLITALFGWLVLQGLLSQNLVPNPNFDEYTECPFDHGQISLAYPWYSPNARTTDFAHLCAGTGFAGVPANYWGTESPVAGSGYAGIRTWGTFNGGDAYREYLAVKLIDSLQAGEKYRVSFWVSLGDSAQFVTDDIALHFSKDSIPNLEVLPFSPHISNPEGNIIRKSVGWEQISGQYIAAGGEQHLVIGNFLEDSLTTLELSNLPIGLGASSTYFYVDQVIVEPCSQEFPDRLFTAEDSILCPGESTNLITENIPGAFYTWENGSNDTLRSISQAGIYRLKAEINGCYQYDSIAIRVDSIHVFDLGTDTTLCPTEIIQIGLEDSLVNFRWNDFHPNLQRTIETAGNYVLEVSAGACVYSDSIEITYEQAYEQAPPIDTLLCESDRVVFLPSVENANYLWSTLSTKPSLETGNMGQYWVDITSTCFSAREYFTLSTENCGCESFVPNVFSPNDDGIQDIFRLSFTEGISDYSFDVFDRYGRPFFRSKSPEESWDGRLNGKNASEGVYFWVAQYTCFAQGEFRQQVKKGHVSLLR